MYLIKNVITSSGYSYNEIVAEGSKSELLAILSGIPDDEKVDYKIRYFAPLNAVRQWT